MSLIGKRNYANNFLNSLISLRKTMHMKNQSFTLIELLITVTLVGIIAAFAIPNFDKAYKRAKEKEMIQNLYAINAGMLLYKARYGSLPDPNVVLLEAEVTPPYNHTLINSTFGIAIPPSDIKFTYYSTQTGGTHKVRAISPWLWNVHFYDESKWISCGCIPGLCSPCPTCPDGEASTTGCVLINH